MKSLEEKNIFTNPAMLVVFALITCALWGAAFPAVKIGMVLFGVEDTGSKILFAGYRFFLAGVLTLAVVSIMEKRILTIKASSMPYVLMQGIIQTTLQYVFFYIGLSFTTGTKGSIINSANGFFSIIIAHFLLKDRITVRKVIGCLIGFAGVILVNMEGLGADAGDGSALSGLFSGFAMKGEGMIVLCSIAFGLSSVTMKMISDRETPNAITAYQLISGGAILIAIGKTAGGHLNTVTLESAFCMLVLVLISTVAFCLWGNLLKYNPVGKVTVFSFTIPVFGVLLSVIFLKENAMSLPVILALFLVSIGIIIVNREKIQYSEQNN